MPEHDSGDVPISSDRTLRTAISQAHRLGLRTVRITPDDQPALRSRGVKRVNTARGDSPVYKKGTLGQGTTTADGADLDT